MLMLGPIFIIIIMGQCIWATAPSSLQSKRGGASASKGETSALGGGASALVVGGSLSKSY